MQAKTIEQKLRKDFPDAELTVNDLTGSGDHWRVGIKSQKFVGLNLIDQHKLVYQSLAEYLPQEIHALQLTTDVLDPIP